MWYIFQCVLLQSSRWAELKCGCQIAVKATTELGLWQWHYISNVYLWRLNHLPIWNEVFCVWKVCLYQLTYSFYMWLIPKYLGRPDWVDLFWCVWTVLPVHSLVWQSLYIDWIILTNKSNVSLGRPFLLLQRNTFSVFMFFSFNVESDDLLCKWCTGHSCRLRQAVARVSGTVRSKKLCS